MFQKIVYDNGLKVILNKQESTAAVTVLVMVKVGSRYERKNLGGIAHFTEHMMFKGTKKRPDTLSLSQELDNIGADYNAFTSKEFTGYYIKTQASELPLAIDIISDMLFNSKFDQNEIEREKGVIIEEINMYEDAPMLMLEDVFDGLAYRGSSLAREVAGTKQTVSGLSRDDFLKFIRDHYSPDNMFVSISGNINEDKVAKLLVRKFKVKKSGSTTTKTYNRVNIKPARPRVFIKKKKTEQVHLALGFVNRLNHRSKILLPLQLASIAFGGNMSSRLFINIREREGLCYYIRSKANVFDDVGNFTVYAGLDKSRLENAIKLIVKEFDRLQKHGLTGKELNKAKEYLQGKLILSLEDSAVVAQWYADKYLFGKQIETPEQFMTRLKAIKLKEVNKVLHQLIKEKYMNLALIGNLKDTRVLKNLLVLNN